MVNERSTSVAALKLAFPACDARIVQVPEDTVVTAAVEVPAESVDDPTVQTDVVRLENDTVRPLAEVVAEMETVFEGWNVWFAGVPNVMVWLAFVTENDCVTVGAAFHVVLPL
jgi:NADPH-dependent ferric siderophore reductase